VAKGPEAFRTISEAAAELNVPQHVLRFWETKFSFIRPMKRAGGRRFYRPHDVAILHGVRRLLHDQGYTIKGVQRLHKEEGVKRLVAAGLDSGAVAPPLEDEVEAARSGPPPISQRRRAALLEALRDLEAAQARLHALLRRD
jgi:DNA-binding transcriptional MerR regulator